MAFHGYGQLANHFINKFTPVAENGRLIIAPEGLSRFYLSGHAGKVGATWMTKEDRLTDIDNYLNYLDAIYEHEILSLNQDTELDLLGFSQGVSTLIRWITFREVPFRRMILWAGVIPPDLDFILSKEKLKGKEVVIVYGKEDPYVSKESINIQKKALEKLGVEALFKVFPGEHDIDPDVLKEVL